MLQLNRVRSIVLMAPVFLGASILPLGAAIAAEMETADQPWQPLLNLLIRQKEDKDPPLISRGPGLCIVEPFKRGLGKAEVVWSDRPLFVWQGQIQKIEVYEQNAKTPLWEQPIASTERSKSYTGPTLKPGKTYEWHIYQVASERAVAFISFRMMEAPDRDRIAQDLQALDTRLKQTKASPEEIAMRRASYFADQELWADVLQQLMSVKDPSPEFALFMQELPGQLCEIQKPGVER